MTPQADDASRSVTGPATVLPLQWSYWCPCRPRPVSRGPRNPDEGIPAIAGLCVIGREDPQSKGFRIVHIEITYNLGQAFERLLTVGSPIYAELEGGQCFMRWAPVARRSVREYLLSVVRKWLALGAPAGSKPAVVEQLLSPEIFEARRN
jgi:hypothetical protein